MLHLSNTTLTKVINAVTKAQQICAGQLPIPKMYMIGDQSSGKTTAISAILGRVTCYGIYS
jgi:hypothetical protein